MLGRVSICSEMSWTFCLSCHTVTLASCSKLASVPKNRNRFADVGGVAYPAHFVRAHHAAIVQFEEGRGIGKVVAEHADVPVEHAVVPLVPHPDAADADGVRGDGTEYAPMAWVG